LSSLRRGATVPTEGNQLADLLSPLRAAGIDVRATIDAARLPEARGHAVYRVVREALTNVLRHAHATTVTIVVAHSAELVHVEVCDDGRTETSPNDSNGHGLTGMRERVTALVGQIEAGPDTDGGWRVAARIPVAG
jgi:signal transduction histidine kinase